MVHFEDPEEGRDSGSSFEVTGSVAGENGSSMTENSQSANPEDGSITETNNSSCSHELPESPEESAEQAAAFNKEKLDGSHEFPEHVDSPEEARVAGECKAIVDSLFALRKPEDIPVHTKWCQKRDALIASLKESGITQAQLDECRMYHVLASSTPSAGTIKRFDLVDSDEIIDFIKNYKKRNGLE